jgi:hypothetical protein
MSQKINWIELIKNTGGKLSGSGFLGLLTGVVALGCFISGIVLVYKLNDKGLEVMMQSAYLLTLAGALMGIRRFTTQKDKKDETNI